MWPLGAPAFAIASRGAPRLPGACAPRRGPPGTLGLLPLLSVLLRVQLAWVLLLAMLYFLVIFAVSTVEVLLDLPDPYDRPRGWEERRSDSGGLAARGKEDG